MSAYRNWGKRAFDVAVSGAALVLLSPVLAITALAVRMNFGAPVLFRQRRPGRNGKPFVILKFRSMRDTRDASQDLLSDEERLDGFGRMLRATSIDELPEFWNVLRGDMSIVGPRPLLIKYLSRYSSEQARRHDVRPGITGLAQVSGRNAVSWEEKFALDINYVDSCSFALDMKILLRTAIAIVRRDGISQPGHATMAEFTGTKT